MTIKENKAWITKLISIFIAILLSVLGWAANNVYDNLVKADEVNEAAIIKLEAKVGSTDERLDKIDSTLLVSNMLDSIGTATILNEIENIKDMLK